MSHGGDTGEHQGSPLPVFPSHFSQWFLHHIPERKNHDGKVQITPSPLLVTRFLFQGLHQDDKLESFQNGNTIP
ncbi:hypothetical protein DV515_00007865 [Chloebia gouldiae]|uniref:Uncharacterized protein n=1 Tax=Chloebia gouldiae TaxID=44316 RepID=A0A3L8SG61_CHLGU|nr:hypothetical protein DV515_00007865 [Chloebia gouldiae]